MLSGRSQTRRNSTTLSLAQESVMTTAPLEAS